MKLRKFFLFFISVFSGLAIVVYLLLRAGFKKVLKAVFILSWWQILIIFLIEVLILFLIIKKWQILVKPYGYKNQVKKLIPAFLGERAISYLTPIIYIGGEGFKAYLIKKNEEKSFIKTFSLIIVDRIAEGVALLLFLILGGIVSLVFGFYLFGFLLIFSSLIITILIVIASQLSKFFFFLSKIFGLHKIAIEETNHQETLEEKIDKEVNLVKNYLYQRRNFFNLDIVISFFSNLLSCLQIYLLLFFWGYRLDLFKIYLIRVFSLLSGLVPTPGSIGGFEGATAFIFTILNLDLSYALSFALVIRFIQIIFVTVGILFVVPYLTKFIIPLTDFRK